MTTTLPRPVDEAVFVAYGQAVFGIQGIEKSLKITTKEVVIELGQASAEVGDKIDDLPLGALIDRLARIAPAKFAAAVRDLRNFKENRNYVAHEFFIDFVKKRDEWPSDNWAIDFLHGCQAETVLALHRVEVIAEDLKLPIRLEHSERHDLRLMPIYGLNSTDRIVLRTLAHA